MNKEAIQAYVLQVLLGVVSAQTGTLGGVAFEVEDAVILLQRNGQHFRVTVEPIRLEAGP